MKQLKDSVQGTATQNITDAINELQSEIDSLCQYIKANIGNLDKSVISDKISFIKTNLSSLTVTVNYFTSHLQPNTGCPNPCTNNYTMDENTCSCYCTLSCTSPTEVNNYRYCQCYEYADVSIIYNVSSDANDIVNKLRTVGADPEKVHDILANFLSFENDLGGLRGTLEYYVTELNLTEFSAIIRQYQDRFNNLMTEYYDWYNNSPGGICGVTCGYNEFLVSNCSCFASDILSTYFGELSTFTDLDMYITRFNQNGDKGELEQFQQRSAGIRQAWQDIYNYIYNNYGNYDDSQLQSLVQSAKDQTESLNSDFHAWVLLNNPPVTAAPCAPSCQANQIISLQPCDCVTITDWDTLATIQNALPGLLSDINNLGDSSNKDTLTTNW